MLIHTIYDQITNAYTRYVGSEAKDLSDVYNNCSREKRTAFDNCKAIMGEKGGYDMRIVGANKSRFSVGFKYRDMFGLYH